MLELFCYCTHDDHTRASGVFFQTVERTHLVNNANTVIIHLELRARRSGNSPTRVQHDPIDLEAEGVMETCQSVLKMHKIDDAQARPVVSAEMRYFYSISVQILTYSDNCEASYQL